jgi:hypothetical protein
MVSFYEHGNEQPDFIKQEKMLVTLRDYILLMKDRIQR